MKLTILVAIFLTITTISIAKPPEITNPDSELSSWFKSLRQPNTNFLCCDVSDCRITELRESPNNSTDWQVLVSKKIFGNDAPDAWMDIPHDKILHEKNNPTGQVVVCWYQHQIFCTVLPTLF